MAFGFKKKLENQKIIGTKTNEYIDELTPFVNQARKISDKIEKLDLNNVANWDMNALGFKCPWGGNWDENDFDKFMSDPNNHLTFS